MLRKKNYKVGNTLHNTVIVFWLIIGMSHLCTYLFIYRYTSLPPHNVLYSSFYNKRFFYILNFCIFF